jgi:hypothetical protein
METSIRITDIAPNGSFSVLTETETGLHREALAPGQFERAREILPDELHEQACGIWTDEVVQAWKELASED